MQSGVIVRSSRSQRERTRVGGERDGRRGQIRWARRVSSEQPMVGATSVPRHRHTLSSEIPIQQVRAPAGRDPDPAAGYAPFSGGISLGCSTTPRLSASPAAASPHITSTALTSNFANILNAVNGSISFQLESYMSRPAGHSALRTSPSSSKTHSNRARSYHRLSREDLRESA